MHYHINELNKCENAPKDAEHNFHNITLAKQLLDDEWQDYDISLFDQIIEYQQVIIQNLRNQYIDTISSKLHRTSNGEYIHTNEMFITLVKNPENWIHPSLITPKSANFNISLNDASKRFAKLQMKYSPKKPEKLNFQRF